MMLAAFLMPLHLPGTPSQHFIQRDLSEIDKLDRLAFEEAKIGEHSRRLGKLVLRIWKSNRSASRVARAQAGQVHGVDCDGAKAPREEATAQALGKFRDRWGKSTGCRADSFRRPTTESQHE